MFHRKLLYLGKLEGLDEVQRVLLVDRLESLLLYRYEGECEDKEVEALACHYLGKLYSRQRGHSEGGEKLSVEGGTIVEDREERISLGSLIPVRVREVGAEWVCCQAMEQLGLRHFLVEQGGWRSEDADRILMNLQGRLLYPSSERKTALWLAEQSGAQDWLAGSQRIGLGHLYGVSVQLLKERETLEDYLYKRLDALLDFGKERFLYDLTNTYFEGRMLDSSLAQYGRSKERRSDCRLVSVGLLTNELGFIRRSHFYAGNVSEPGTLEQIVTYLRDSQGVLTDAGIGTTNNIEELALRGVGYMCVVPAGFKEYEVDFSQAAEFEHQTSNGQRYKVWLQVEEHSFRVGQQLFKDWLIFVKSEAKQAKEDGIISKQKQRMEVGLDQIRQSLSNPRGHRKTHQVHQRIGRLKLQNSKVSKAFDIQAQDDGVHVTQLQWHYDTRYEQRNGTYIIRTSEPVTDARQAWQVYHTLSTIEGVNRCCKSDLNMRPVYHRKDEPIQAHLFLTLLACTIVTYIRHLLGKKGIYWSWKEIVRILSTQKSILSEFRNKQGELFLLSKWSEPEPKALAIYQALGYKIRRSPGFFFKIAADDP